MWNGGWRDHRRLRDNGRSRCSGSLRVFWLRLNLLFSDVFYERATVFKDLSDSQQAGGITPKLLVYDCFQLCTFLVSLAEVLG